MSHPWLKLLVHLLAVETWLHLDDGGDLEPPVENSVKQPNIVQRFVVWVAVIAVFRLLRGTNWLVDIFLRDRLVWLENIFVLGLTTNHDEEPIVVHIHAVARSLDGPLGMLLLSIDLSPGQFECSIKERVVGGLD